VAHLPGALTVTATGDFCIAGAITLNVVLIGVAV